MGVEAIDWCGGVYSSEWGFSKLLHWLRNNSAKQNLHETLPGGGVSSARMKMCEIRGRRGDEAGIGNGAVNDP
jgi:hypothetical protein